MKTVVFLNAHSRQGGRLAERVSKELPTIIKDHQIIETIIVNDSLDFEHALKKLKAFKSFDCVIVGSGDGTIVAVLNALKHRRDIIYGFIPLGTSNTFVRSLGLPPDYKKAMRVIKNGVHTKASLGKVSNHLFANIAGIGLPVRVSNSVSNKTKRYLGDVAYVITGLKELVTHNSFKCEVKFDGKTEVFYSHHLLIANGPYHGGLALSKELSAFDNTLLIVSFGTNSGRLRYAKSIVRFGLEKHLNDPDTKIFPVTSANITTHPVRHIEVDGETVGKTPALFTVKQNAIAVFVPKQKVLSRK